MEARLKIIRPTLTTLFLFAALLALPIACVMDSTPLGADGGTTPGTSNTMPATLYALFVNYNCNVSGCHNANGNAPHLDSAASSYSAMVNVAAGETCTDPSATLYIKPSDAANSVLMLKLLGQTCASSQMPLGGGAMSNSDKQALTNWINAGALSGP
jgi:hypothetical protein